jgi:type I restriction enzyme, R subunit
MWITGFDVPTCSTIYLDKPMRNHTLMQTIARANRVAPGKPAGLIVDYVGVFRDLQKALAIYAAPMGREGDQPIKDKAELVEQLRAAIAQVVAWCGERGVDLGAIRAASGFERVRLIDDGVEVIVAGEESKRAFVQQAAHVARTYKAILPDPAAGDFAPDAILIAFLGQKMRSRTPPADISGVMDDIEDLLDRSIATHGYVIRAAEEEKPALVNLSELDFEALQARFASSRRHTEAERLKGQIERKLRQMVALNRTRVDFLEKFQRMIEDYNAGSKNIEAFFAELLSFAQDLSEEEKRGIAEGLSEEELTLFDLLTKPEPKLTRKEQAEVKRVCKALLETLKAEKLVLDWRSRQQSRAAVRLWIEKVLDELPATYDEDLWRQKFDLAFQHIFEGYADAGHSVYATA